MSDRERERRERERRERERERERERARARARAFVYRNEPLHGFALKSVGERGGRARARVIRKDIRQRGG